MSDSKKEPNKIKGLSISQLSRLTGKDRGTISTRLQDMKPLGEDKRAKYFDPVEALPVIYAAESFKGMQKKTEMVAYEIEREKLNKIRQENEERAGKLVPIDEVAKTVEREYSFVKAQIGAIPARLSKPLSMESDPSVCNAMLSDAIQEALNELTAPDKYAEHLKELQKVENEINPTSNSNSEQPIEGIETKTQT